VSRTACAFPIAALLTLTSCTTKSGDEPKPEASTLVPADRKFDETKAPKGAEATAAARQGTQIPAPPDVAAPPANAEKTASGLAYVVLQEGRSGEHPRPVDTVEVAYTGWTTDGKTFDTTEGKGTRTFALGRVIPGWTEGVALMTPGSKVRFWVPEELAYKGRPGAPQGMLVFDIELLAIHAAPDVPDDVAAPPTDAKRTKGGVAYRVLQPGTGDAHPRPWDKVTVHYSGWTTDGKMFDSSVQRGQPATLTLSQVVEGWKEGIPTMVVGEKKRLWVPKELAYEGKPGAPQGMLVFDVELLEIEHLPEPPPAPETPADVAAPPADTQKTESGLAYKVLAKGDGDQRPTEDSRVTVHYSGWTTDGKMFDSSVTRGQPATFPLKGVIKGWTEGLQLMTKGDKMRFWIPVELAYQNRPGKPAGMLVFDVELIGID
jgi:FKBP-type peptidyl-prolyl cis-trans isomerase